MSWETQRLEKAKQIIEDVSPKEVCPRPPALLGSRQRWIHIK